MSAYCRFNALTQLLGKIVKYMEKNELRENTGESQENLPKTAEQTERELEA